MGQNEEILERATDEGHKDTIHTEGEDTRTSFTQTERDKDTVHTEGERDKR